MSGFRNSGYHQKTAYSDEKQSILKPLKALIFSDFTSTEQQENSFQTGKLSQKMMKIMEVFISPESSQN